MARSLSHNSVVNEVLPKGDSFHPFDRPQEGPAGFMIFAASGSESNWTVPVGRFLIFQFAPGGTGFWGCSSVGRAVALQAIGQEFDSPQLHQP